METVISKEGTESTLAPAAATAGAIPCKMRIVAVMPTMRWWNWSKVGERLRIAAIEAPEVALTWMPVMTEEERQQFPSWAIEMILDADAWAPMLVRPVLVAEPVRGDGQPKVADQKLDAVIKDAWPVVVQGHVPCVKEVMRKNNATISALADHDAYFWTGSDDNLVPRSFCRRFMEGLPKKIIVGGHKRGSGPGESGHGISDLVAEPASMRIGSVSGEQYIIHGSVMRGRTLLGSGCPDGQIMADLIAEMPHEFHFIRDFWIPFNAMEQGRWKPGEVEKLLAS